MNCIQCDGYGGHICNGDDNAISVNCGDDTPGKIVRVCTKIKCPNAEPTRMCDVLNDSTADTDQCHDFVRFGFFKREQSQKFHLNFVPFHHTLI